jgi:2-phosphoglycerate kinase
MIYIITGVAKSGKTYVTNQLLNQKQIASFRTDYLMMSLSKANHTGGVNHDDDDKVVSKQLEPFLYGMIETMVQNNIDYIIEGVHFLPSFAKELLTKFPSKIKVCFLGFKDANPIEKKMELKKYSSIMENCWFGHYSDKELIILVEFLIQESKVMYQKTEELGISYFEITDITKQSIDIIQYLIDK